MKRKSILGVLALIMLVASLGAAQAFGGNYTKVRELSGQLGLPGGLYIF